MFQIVFHNLKIWSFLYIHFKKICEEIKYGQLINSWFKKLWFSFSSLLDLKMISGFSQRLSSFLTFWRYWQPSSLPPSPRQAAQMLSLRIYFPHFSSTGFFWFPSLTFSFSQFFHSLSHLSLIVKAVSPSWNEVPQYLIRCLLGMIFCHP